MEVLKIHSKYIEEKELFIHSILFEFAGQGFVAIAHDDEVMTNIAACFKEGDIFYIDLDIPTYFGKGFANDVFDFLYETVEKIDRDSIKSEKER